MNRWRILAEKCKLERRTKKKFWNWRIQYLKLKCHWTELITEWAQRKAGNLKIDEKKIYKYKQREKEEFWKYQHIRNLWDNIKQSKTDIIGGTSLVVQGVRLHIPNAGGPGPIPGWGTRSYMHATTKSLNAATNSPHAATKKKKKGFPGGAVVENLPANAGDTGSSPGLGRSHMLWSNWAREPQLLSLHIWSLCSATREAATVRGPRTTMKSGPHSLQLEKALAQKRRPNTTKNKYK